MNQRNHLTLTAAAATMMATMPLNVLFSSWTWIFQALFAIALVCSSLMAARVFRVPLWTQPLIGFVALLFVLTWECGNRNAYGGIFPDAATFRYFQSLVVSGGDDMSQLAIPVANTNGLLFLTTAGIGLSYVLIDFFAVGLRRPALAGLPMLAIYAVPVSIDRHSTGLVSFAIAACGFLWLLVSDNIDRVRLFGRRFTGDGRGLDVWESSPLASIGRRITAIGVVLAIAVPGILPGVGDGFVKEFGNGPGGDGPCTAGVCSGSGHTLNLFASLAGSLKNGPSEQLMTVQSTEPFPEYLQIGTLDVLTNKGFGGFTPTGNPTNQPLPLPARIDGVKYHPYTAKINIQKLDGNLLPLDPVPDLRSLRNIGSGWSYDSDSYTLFSSDDHAASAVTSYSFNYLEPDYGDGKVLESAGLLQQDDPIAKTDTFLPQSVPQVTNIVSQLPPADIGNEYKTVVDLYNYFSKDNGFVYTTSTKLGDTGSDIGNFLEQKRGFCVQYASALAWLVRAAHYPARVVVGFTEGVPIDATTWEITNKDYHAWTEVDFPGFGWVPFDATPSSGLNGPVHRGWDKDSATSTGPAPKIRRSTAGVAPASGGPVAKQSRPGTVPNSTPGTRSKPTPVWVWWMLAGIAILLLAVCMPALTRAFSRRMRASADRKLIGETAQPGEPWVVIDDKSQASATLRRIHAAWDEFIDTLVDYDIGIDPSETPRTTVDRVVRTTELSAECVSGARLISEAEEHARYARRPTTSPPLAPELRRLRKELAYNMPLSTRLRAVLLPPSVVARWNARASDAAARASVRLQVLRERVTGTLQISRWTSAPRRLLNRGRAS